jgi:SOS response regulatory protein OraA/RecX
MAHAGDEAVEAALRALRHRDRSAAQIERHLVEVRGIDRDACAEALATLVRTGLVDDERFAESRAAVLAERGAGDAFIRHDLAAAGVDAALIDTTLDGLESEKTRVDRIVARRGASAKTARYLSAKGFAADVVLAVVARCDDDALG